MVVQSAVPLAKVRMLTRVVIPPGFAQPVGYHEPTDRSVPDDSLLALRDTSIQEIYALEVKLPQGCRPQVCSTRPRRAAVPTPVVVGFCDRGRVGSAVLMPLHDPRLDGRPQRPKAAPRRGLRG